MENDKTDLESALIDRENQERARLIPEIEKTKESIESLKKEIEDNKGLITRKQDEGEDLESNLAQLDIKKNALKEN